MVTTRHPVRMGVPTVMRVCVQDHGATRAPACEGSGTWSVHDSLNG
jgi:hypothetical protein